MLIPHLLSWTINCPCLTVIYEKWCSPKSCKLQRSRQRKLQSVFTTHACNRPCWSLHRGTMLFKLVQVIQPYWSLHPAWSIKWGIFNCSVHGNSCSQIIPTSFFFHLQLFHLCHFSWIGHWRKMRYQNVDEKIPETSVSIIQ